MISKLFIAGLIIIFSSCATSMPPSEVNRRLPLLTKSKFISPTQASEAISSNSCKYISNNRKYSVPIGLTTQTELKAAAKAIDEWVNNDGANAYVLRNYQWIAVGDKGATQLHIEFDTLLCN